MSADVWNVSVIGRTFEDGGRHLRLSPAYSFVLDFEYWDVGAGTELMAGYWWVSVLIASLYLPLSVRAEAWMSSRKPLSLRPLLIFWNSLLCAFSVFGFLRMSPELFYVLRTHGVHYSICNNSFGAEAVTGFWTEMFGWSKLAELLDTVFLVARKRPLTPLHLWHHASVYIFTWHACRWYVAAGRWFVTMNFAVHGAMYGYFALKALGRPRIPYWVSVALTSAQILQMIIGVSITAVVWNKKSNGTPCDHHDANLYFSLLIYASYAALFGHFFVKAYVLPLTKPKKT